MKQTQLLHIHGGMTFSKYDDYLDYLRNKTINLDDKKRWYNQYIKASIPQLEVIVPIMPSKHNARYEEWKIWFELHFQFLEDDCIFSGSSLGGIFLAKYLSENEFPKKILAVYLIAPPYDNSLPGEELVGGFELKDDLSLFEKNCSHITILASRTDEDVPVDHIKKYLEKLSNVRFIEFEDKNGHFQIEEFPEIVDMIKEDLRRIE